MSNSIIPPKLSRKMKSKAKQKEERKPRDLFDKIMSTKCTAFLQMGMDNAHGAFVGEENVNGAAAVACRGRTPSTSDDSDTSLESIQSSSSGVCKGKFGKNTRRKRSAASIECALNSEKHFPSDWSQLDVQNRGAGGSGHLRTISPEDRVGLGLPYLNLSYQSPPIDPNRIPSVSGQSAISFPEGALGHGHGTIGVRKIPLLSGAESSFQNTFQDSARPRSDYNQLASPLNNKGACSLNEEILHHNPLNPYLQNVAQGPKVYNVEDDMEEMKELSLDERKMSESKDMIMELMRRTCVEKDLTLAGLIQMPLFGKKSGTNNTIFRAIAAAAQRRPRTAKTSIPDASKDEKYFERRKRNNLAAKKSRDTRKQREDQVALRASFLEKENAVLRAQVATLRDEALSLRQLILQRKPQQFHPYLSVDEKTLK